MYSDSLSLSWDSISSLDCHTPRWVRHNQPSPLFNEFHFSGSGSLDIRRHVTNLSNVVLKVTVKLRGKFGQSQYLISDSVLALANQDNLTLSESEVGSGFWSSVCLLLITFQPFNRKEIDILLSGSPPAKIWIFGVRTPAKFGIKCR